MPKPRDWYQDDYGNVWEWGYVKREWKWVKINTDRWGLPDPSRRVER